MANSNGLVGDGDCCPKPVAWKKPLKNGAARLKWGFAVKSLTKDLETQKDLYQDLTMALVNSTFSVRRSCVPASRRTTPKRLSFSPRNPGPGRRDELGPEAQQHGQTVR